MSKLKELGLLLYLLPLYGLIICIDLAANDAKRAYKRLHELACVLSRHVNAVMAANNLPPK